MRRLEKVFGRKMIVTQIFPIDKYKINFYNWKQFLARGLQFQHGQYFAVSCFLDLRLPFIYLATELQPLVVFRIFSFSLQLASVSVACTYMQGLQPA